MTRSRNRCKGGRDVFLNSAFGSHCTAQLQFKLTQYHLHLMKYGFYHTMHYGQPLLLDAERRVASGDGSGMSKVAQCESISGCTQRTTNDQYQLDVKLLQ
jgi:hypothetical protein